MRYRRTVMPLFQGAFVSMFVFALIPDAVIAAGIIDTNVSLGTTVLPDTNSNSSPFTDDVLLNSLTIGNANFAASDSFRAVRKLKVIKGRGAINAEWGDNDDDSDGDDNPFAKSGNPNANQETIDPTVQDPALRNALNSLSLSEMTDGEAGGDSKDGFSFKFTFQNSLKDNSPDDDNTPEILLFERDGNDEFEVELITGGTFDAPELSDPVAVNSADFADTGIDVNTVEIGNPQSVTVGGLDLNSFTSFNATSDRVFGLQITTDSENGPDFNGLFLAAEDSNDFSAPLIPEPSSVTLGLAGLVLLGWRIHRYRDLQSKGG